MNVRILRTFSYWCSATCILLFAGDLSTQQLAVNKEMAADVSFSSRANHFAYSLGQSSVFVAHSVAAGVSGAYESAGELLPYLVDTTIDVTKIVCRSIAHPVEAYETCCEKITEMAAKVADFFATLDWKKIVGYYRLVELHYTEYCALSPAERGEKFGHLIGYHLMDFYGGTLAIKACLHVKKHAYVQQLISRKAIPSVWQIGPAERVKGFAIAVNHATRRERYMYDLRRSLAEPRNTRSYGTPDYDGMRLLLDCSPLRAVGADIAGARHISLQVGMHTMTAAAS